MYNLHCHSLLSDGLLLPSEVAVHYQSMGYKVIAITDHVDYSNIDITVDAIVKFASHWPKKSSIKVMPGVELTHVPIEQFLPLARHARKRGAKIIVGHGETLTEPVTKGTNRAAIMAGVDILAHPGLITEAEVKLAKAKGVFLEITSRRGHCDTNMHVAGLALKYGARLILSTDSHSPEDIIAAKDLNNTGLKAGLEEKRIKEIYSDTQGLIRRRLNEKK
ncbi:MAG: histidinol phosphate phosphatase domain-containing protein [Candidatus Omnitrophica bacterium]|nr:histidinol phosphate phosphatase domain-containing protein [Candidatus Omnitrophota bacterium]